jgi:hypothetical protein
MRRVPSLDTRQLLEDLASLPGLGLRKPGVQLGGVTLVVQQRAPTLDLTSVDLAHHISSEQELLPESTHEGDAPIPKTPAVRADPRSKVQAAR